MKTSEKIGKLSEALAKAQGAMENPEKNKTVTVPGKYAFDYADLPECYRVSKKLLADNGISHPSTIEYRDRIPFLVMRLQLGEEWIESEWLLSGSEKTLAASITYGKRYLFCALVGIAADDDIDDPQEEDPKDVTDKGKKISEDPGLKPDKPKIVSPEIGKEVILIRNLQKELKISDVDFNADLWELFKVDTMKDLSLEQLKMISADLLKIKADYERK